jgi:hypothetical protein
LLRIDEEVLAQLQRWAESELRSLNGHIEYLLRDALAKKGIKVSKEGTEEEKEPESK